MARPRKQAEQKRSRVIAFRVTDEEYDRVQIKAGTARLEVGDFARLAALNRPVVVNQNATPDIEAVDQLRRLGVNFNQIARALNSGGVLPQNFQRLCVHVESLLERLFAEYLGRDSAHR